MKRYRSKYPFFAVTMAFLLFLASAGFAVDMHYCSGELKSVSFLGKAKSCHEKGGCQITSMKNCPHHADKTPAKSGCSEDKNCCSNKTLHFQSDQDQRIQASNFVINNPLKQFVIACVTALFPLDVHLEQVAVPWRHYKPPLIPKDIPVLVQSFLF